jgi:starch-binding outer membrane protein, SusD/RagB family
MRFKATISAGLVGLVSLAGCMDLDENIVAGVTSSYFETPAGLEDAVDAAYSYLQSHYGQERNMTMLEYGTDIWAKGADGSHKQWNDYTAQLDPRTAYTTEQWDQSYQAINTTNAVINRAAGITSGITDALKSQRVAEARFLRAFYYFYLVRHYGDVHITMDETQGVVTEAHRSPAAEVYSKVIIPDLEAAVATLPATQAQFGRATKGAAQHLLALVYLTRLDAGDAAKAEPLLRAVVTSGLYSLEPRYVDLFCQARTAAVPCTVPTNERKAEVVFSVQNTPDPLTTGQGNRWHLYYGMEYDIQTGMTRTTTYGRPFKRLRVNDYFLSLHDEAIDSRFEDSFQFVWLANKGDAAAGIAIGDTAIFLPNVKTSKLPAVYKGKKYMVATEPENFWSPVRSNPVPGAPNVKTEYSTNVFPTMIKFWDPNRSSTNEERSERDFVVYRLADTYLMLAESLIRQGKPAEAVEWVNRVRRRAARPGMQAAMEVGVDKMNLDFILEERARELFGEGHRWFDLKRFGKLIEYKALRDPEARPNIKPFHVLRPIPQTQIDRTKNPDGASFGQNPGY